MSSPCSVKFSTNVNFSSISSTSLNNCCDDNDHAHDVAAGDVASVVVLVDNHNENNNSYDHDNNLIGTSSTLPLTSADHLEHQHQQQFGDTVVSLKKSPPLVTDRVVEESDLICRQKNTSTISSAGSKWTSYLIFCNFTTVIGSTFLYGYNMAVVNEPLTLLEAFVNASYQSQHGGKNSEVISEDTLHTLWAVTVALYFAGGSLGAIGGPSLAHRVSIRRTLMLADGLFGISGGICMFVAPFVNLFELFMVGRFLAGLHSGLATSIIPNYLADVAPLKLRGAVGTFSQLSILLGLTSAAILGMPEVMGRDDPQLIGPTSFWALLFLPCLFLPLIQIFLMIFTVESPKWLLLVARDEDKARTGVVQNVLIFMLSRLCLCLYIALNRLRGVSSMASNNNESAAARDVAAEFANLQADVELQRSNANGKSALEFCEVAPLVVGWPLVIGVVMHAAHRLCGITIVAYYSTFFFEKAGVDKTLAEYASVGLYCVQIPTTIVSTLIIERLGRRILMIGGLIGMLVCSIILTICLALEWLLPDLTYGVVAALFVFAVAFAIGPGVVPWFVAPELFPPLHRPVAIALCTLTNWLASTLVAFAFPPMADASGAFMFMPFVGLLVVFIVFTVLFLPETRGITTDVIRERIAKSRLQIQQPSQ